MRSALAAALAAAIALALPKAQSGDALDALSKRVEEQEKRLGELSLELATTRAALEESVQCLQANGKAASDLERVFAESELAGFTKGINWRSREILLDGLRAFAASQQKNVPKAKPAAAKPAERAAR